MFIDHSRATSRRSYRPGGNRHSRRFMAARPRIEWLEGRRLLSLSGTATPVPAQQAELAAAFGQIPLSFELNQGQTAPQVNFLSRGPGYTLFLTPEEAVVSLQHTTTPGPGAAPSISSSDVVSMQLVGGSTTANVVGMDPQAGTSNDFIGNDPSQWRTGVPNYGRVEYQGVYPGVDLVYYGNQQQLEYDFVVAPGADPKAITLAFAGAESMSLDGAGDLVLQTAGGDLVEQAPVLYQDINGTRQTVVGSYQLEGDNRVDISVGAYDTSQPLVIDPILVYSTYLGGTGDDSGTAIAVDGAGNAYVTGWTTSTNFPTANPLQPSNDGGEDAFVAKLSPSGALNYSTYFGGSGDDQGYGIAVDSAGDAYVTGETDSTNFPTTAGAFQTTYGGGNYDAFITKLNPAGNALVYSTYLGGTGTDVGSAIAVDSSGNAYVTGGTTTGVNPPTIDTFPLVNAFQSNFDYGESSADAFVTKLNATGTELVYSTFLGGSNADAGSGIAVDASGDAVVTGYTNSTNFPIYNALQPSYGGGTGPGGGSDAFVTKFDAAGTALIYSTYLGGSGNDLGTGVAVDSAGDAFVTGYTDSTNFPIVNAFQPAYGGGTDNAFVTKINPNGSAFDYSTYLGGNGEDWALGIAVDSAGNAYITGTTSSTKFPIVDAVQPTYGGNGDAFISKVNAIGSALLYSTYLGGGNTDLGIAIAVDIEGTAYVTGSTGTDFPTLNPLQPAYGGGSEDVWVAKVTSTSASQLVVASQPPTSLTAGSPFGFAVAAEDQYGNIDTQYSGSVTIALTNNPGGATLGGTLTIPFTEGVATFSGLSLNKAGSGYEIQEATSGLAAATIGPITVIPAPATQLLVTTPPPASLAVGSDFGFSIAAEDPYANVNPDFIGSATLAIANGPGGATLGGTLTATISQGVATFSDLTLSEAGSYLLEVSCNGLAPVIVGPIDVTPAPATAVFLPPLNTWTQGNWNGVYGFQGYKVIGGTSSLPAYATITPAGYSSYTWTTSTTDPRALQNGSPSTGRVAAVWYSATSFTVDVNLIDAQAHDLELYFDDWDNEGRAETVQISNVSGTVLDTVSIASFANGVYLDWKVSGDLVIKITDTAGVNAVLNGLFLDADPPSSSGMRMAPPVRLSVGSQGLGLGIGSFSNVAAIEMGTVDISNDTADPVPTTDISISARELVLDVALEQVSDIKRWTKAPFES
jgi:hypothetical protein